MPTEILGLDLAAVAGLVLFLAWLERRDRRGRHRAKARARQRPAPPTKTARHVASGGSAGSVSGSSVGPEQRREPEQGDLHRSHPAA
jgi:hypothetical protein